MNAPKVSFHLKRIGENVLNYYVLYILGLVKKLKRNICVISFSFGTEALSVFNVRKQLKQMNEKNIVKTVAEKAMEFVQKLGINLNDLIVVGFSFGTFIATYFCIMVIKLNALALMLMGMLFQDTLSPSMNFSKFSNNNYCPIYFPISLGYSCNLAVSF